MKSLLLITLIVCAANLPVTQFSPVDKGSSVLFNIKNFGINTGGSFTGLQGTIRFDSTHLNETSFDISIDANTVNTGNEARDNHLRKDTYFDVSNYPRIHFRSTIVTSSPKAGDFLLFGKLTIKNKTKDISFPFTATPSSEGYLFKGVFTINRRDFDVGGASIISDNLEVQLSIAAKK